MSIVASAPGKLVLLGEYAVLEGAPAISMAVNRRARVNLRSRGGSGCQVHAPEVHQGTLPFVIGSNGLPDWSQAGADASKLNLVDEVLRGLADEHLAPAHGFGLQLDTSEFFDSLGVDKPKLGLGSSAALTVALATALVAHAGCGAAASDRSAWLERLLALHRKFQGGLGSGVDVATSLIGGVISYQLFDDGRAPLARDLSLPPALHMRFIWSGRSASTPKFLAHLRAWRDGHEDEYRMRMDRLTAVANQAVAALSDGNGEAFLVEASAYASDLRALGVASGVDIYSTEHAAIAAIAGEFPGLVYKPCGAGGGDVGVVFATDPEALAALTAQLAAAGFNNVPLSVDPTGLRLEHRETPDA